MRQLGLPGSFYRAARLNPTSLSKTAEDRLRWLNAWDALQQQGLSSTEASARLGIARATLYRWKLRLEREGPRGLEPRSRRPHRVRRPAWPPELIEAVRTWRERFPRWGKDKLVVLLRRAGWRLSVSTVGRILASLKARGLLRQPVRQWVSAGKRRRKRPFATRKPRDYPVRLPGDLVQLDTLDLRPLPGVVLKEFTARDILSRWDVLGVRTTASARTAKEFLDELEAHMPFPIRALQIDGGSEYMGEFEEACRQRGLHLFVLPPRSPKLNGHVERANRTHTEEFWECYDGDFDLATVQPALRAWEHLYNTFRPHQALAGRTPLEYLEQCHSELLAPAPLSQMS